MIIIIVALQKSGEVIKSTSLAVITSLSSSFQLSNCPSTEVIKSYEKLPNMKFQATSKFAQLRLIEFISFEVTTQNTY